MALKIVYKYWIPVYNILQNHCTIVLAHPKSVKAIRGTKTDKKDAKWIADLLKHESEKNRLQNCLTVSNIQLGNVVSDTFGKSAQAILDKLLENPADTSFDLESRKAELEELILALAAPYQQEIAILQTAPGISSTSLLSESFAKSVPIWRLFLRRNTYAHGLGLPQPTMKANVAQKQFYLQFHSLGYISFKIPI